MGWSSGPLPSNKIEDTSRRIAIFISPRFLFKKDWRSSEYYFFRDDFTMFSKVTSDSSVDL